MNFAVKGQCRCGRRCRLKVTRKSDLTKFGNVDKVSLKRQKLLIVKELKTPRLKRTR